MNRTFLILLIFCCCKALLAQNSQEKQNNNKRYIQKEVLDSTGTISLYSRLFGATGGDSIMINSAGNVMEGWNEDFYSSGKLLHRGFYVNGKLVTFRNYFENGQCERVVENTDPLHSSENIFFESGELRKKINYYNGKPQKCYEYYENGQPKTAEENEKEMKYLTLKKSWYENGFLKTDLELLDNQYIRYREKSYYHNGQVKEEGQVILLATHEYVKDGTWFFYDSDGKNKRSERHNKGIKLNSR